MALLYPLKKDKAPPIWAGLWTLRLHTFLAASQQVFGVGAALDFVALERLDVGVDRIQEVAREGEEGVFDFIRRDV